MSRTSAYESRVADDEPDASVDGTGATDDDALLDDEPRGVSDRVLGVLMVVTGLVGLAAASVLTYDKFRLLEDPETVLSCDYNPFVSCGGVMTQPQAELFGFPNSFIGMVGFAGVVALAAVVVTGGRLTRVVWAGLQVGVVLGMAFIVWLMTQSIFVIGTLCPYCMVVWAAMIPLFWYVTRRNLATTNGGRPRGLAKVVVDYHVLLVFVSYVAVGATVFLVFGDRLWA